MKLDVLVVGAHPDDAEISAGGTILRLVRAGCRVGVVDVTRGEMGTRGTRANRDAETTRASELLGLLARENLELPDGRVEVTTDARERLAALMRKHRPDAVLAHHVEDLHPDHIATGRLAREAWYLAGLSRLAAESGDSAHRAKGLYHFTSHVAHQPTFVVDVGPVWDERVEVVRCYASQLRPADEDDDGEHFLFGADILERMVTKARYWGESVGARYGEPLLHVGPVSIDDPLIGMLRQ
ncbi:MAG: bacillithiol biosynthesis deacetylase BshB1 [bacterium]|nr:bacillithiol biosynthesis deacetylase BshB1 [bacterium]